MVKLQVDPADLLRRPRLYLDAPWHAWHARPRKVRTGPVLANETTIDQLPQLVSWPDDGGAYVTLPQVYTEDPDRPGFDRSNLGMYRVQLSGGQYRPNDEVGLHYQIHRGISVHHAAAIRRGERLRVNVFVGGPPAMTVAAVMPLPEGVSELALAGVLGRRRVPMIAGRGLPIHAEADFCISGYLEPDRQLPEGPFGDHLGYYSLAHDFPVMRVEQVYHRDDADLAVYRGRPPAAGRHDVRPTDPRDRRAGDSAVDPGRARRPRGRRRRRASAAVGPRQRAIRALRSRGSRANS